MLLTLKSKLRDNWPFWPLNNATQECTDKKITRDFQLSARDLFCKLRYLYGGVKSGRNWHARTPKVTPLNSLFFALCLPKIYNLCRCTFEEATDSESQKILSDLLIICWRKRGFIVFAYRANIGHFFLRRRGYLDTPLTRIREMRTL
jgi:hypothetical protein